MSRPTRFAFYALLALALLSGCSHKSTAPQMGAGAPRTFRMGFSAIPPRPDPGIELPMLEMAARHSDAAIMHSEPAWDSLLAGVPADRVVRAQLVPLAQYWRAKGMALVYTLDLTNGLDRSAESEKLVAAGRSLGEPAIQRLARDWVTAVDTLVHPDWLGLAAETNLIRAASPPALYAAVVQTANDAAADVRARDPNVRLYVSVQVEVAWGALGGTGVFQGIGFDLADFPFVQSLGLSSYPYLGGFADPDSVPLDYYSRVAAGTSLPVLVVEGGWTSASVGGVTSSPESQARWIDRQVALLDGARAVAVFQLTFTDLDLSAIPLPPGSILPLFAALGLVTDDLVPKPALTAWDRAFAGPGCDRAATSEFHEKHRARTAGQVGSRWSLLENPIPSLGFVRPESAQSEPWPRWSLASQLRRPLPRCPIGTGGSLLGMRATRKVPTPGGR